MRILFDIDVAEMQEELLWRDNILSHVYLVRREMRERCIVSYFPAFLIALTLLHCFTVSSIPQTVTVSMAAECSLRIRIRDPEVRISRG